MKRLEATEQIKQYYTFVENLDQFTDVEIENLYQEYKKGNILALECIVNNYLKLVLNIVLKLCSFLDKDTLPKAIQVGNIGLRNALIHYDEYKDNLSLVLIKEIRTSIMAFINQETLDYESLSTPNVPSFQDLNEEKLAVLKSVMSGLEYYVFYCLISSQKKETIAEELSLSSQEIMQLAESALNKYAIYQNPESPKYKAALNKIKKDHQKQKRAFNVRPLSTDEILKFLYVKNSLTSEELAIFKYRYLNVYQYNADEICAILKISRLKYTSLNRNLMSKLTQNDYDQEYLTFKQEMINKYGSELYTIIGEEKEKSISFLEVKKVCDSLDLETLTTALQKQQDILNPDELDLLIRYFQVPQDEPVDKEMIEREINLNKYGFKKKKTSRSDINLVYKTYLAHQQQFNEEQQLYLECYIFKRRDKALFNAQYPNSSLLEHNSYLMERLERLHYGIFKILENTFNKEKYLYVKKNFGDRLTKERIELLDLYYGVDTPPYSIKEIAQMKQMDYTKCHDIISDGREYCISLYTNRTNRLDLDKSLYIPYLTDEYEYTDETRKILTMYLKENLSYNEISAQTGLNKTRISNIITDGIRKIDNYRFGIATVRAYTAEELNAIFAFYKGFTQQAKDIICHRFIDKMENKDIATLMGISLREVNIVIRRFYLIDLKYKTKDITLTIEDITAEINRHSSESLLNDTAKQYLSLYYGIASPYNPQGEKLTSTQIAEKFNITQSSFYHFYYDSITTIKGRKAGVLTPDNNFISRDELAKILTDKKVPISEKEYYIICSLFGLFNYETKDMKTLALELHEGQGSVRRRYVRAIVSIKKYLLGEIEEKIVYEEDIAPLLKYFSDTDKELIELHYKNGVTYEELAKRYNISFERITGIMGRIKNNLFDLMHDPDAKKFDFDYYKEAIKDERLPFYGDLETVTQIFNLFFGMNDIERLGAEAIIKKLNLRVKTNAVHNSIYNLMLSVCKLRDGIYKDKEPTFSQVEQYYKEHEREMPSYHKVYYQRYFARIANTKVINGMKSLISDYILYDLIKDSEPDYVRIDNLTREEVIRLLRNDDYNLSRRVKESLMFYFNLEGRYLMNGKELNHVYRLISALIKQNVLSVNQDCVLKKVNN